jgi:drug/metabolite transporter (DMT)-like permease
MNSMLLGEMAALGAAVCWAAAPIMYRQALFKVSPISANIVRCASNAIFMVVVLFGLGWAGILTSLPVSVLVLTVTSGIIGLVIGDTLYMYGLRYVGVSRAVPLAATYPLFSLVWVTFLLHQPVTVAAVVGAAVILVGIWLISREKGGNTLNVKGRIVLIGLVASLLTAVIWSVSLSLMDIVVSMPGLGTTAANYSVITVRIISTALILMVSAPIIDNKHGFLKVSKKTLLLLCVGGLIANAVGWFLMNYSFLNIAQSQAVPISSTTPLFSVLAGYVLFHEKMTLNNTIGAVIIVVGIVLVFLA